MRVSDMSPEFPPVTNVICAEKNVVEPITLLRASRVSRGVMQHAHMSRLMTGRRARKGRCGGGVAYCFRTAGGARRCLAVVTPLDLLYVRCSRDYRSYRRGRCRSSWEWIARAPC